MMRSVLPTQLCPITLRRIAYRTAHWRRGNSEEHHRDKRRGWHRRVTRAWETVLASHAPEALLACYGSDATLESPVAAHILGGPGVCRTEVLARTPDEQHHHPSGFFTDGRRAIWEYRIDRGPLRREATSFGRRGPVPRESAGRILSSVRVANPRVLQLAQRGSQPATLAGFGIYTEMRLNAFTDREPQFRCRFRRVVGGRFE